MVDGVAVAEDLAEVVPTDPLVADEAAVVATTVVLAYTGVLLAGAL